MCLIAVLTFLSASCRQLSYTALPQYLSLVSFVQLNLKKSLNNALNYFLFQINDQFIKESTQQRHDVPARKKQQSKGRRFVFLTEKNVKVTKGMGIQYEGGFLMFVTAL